MAARAPAGHEAVEASLEAGRDELRLALVPSRFALRWRVEPDQVVCAFPHRNPAGEFAFAGPMDAEEAREGEHLLELLPAALVPAVLRAAAPGRQPPWSQPPGSSARGSKAASSSPRRT